MENIIKVLLVGVVVGFLSGCSDPKIDASSKTALNSSIKVVMEDLDDEEKKEFDDALKMTFMSIAFTSPGSSDREIREKLALKLDGKTAEEVIESVKN